jgi:sulfur relay (sulfurtransferase) complex TusBCD TusD component (DsrE family)
MKNFLLTTLALVVLGMATAGCTARTTVTAPKTAQGAPLFINLTSDDAHRVNMALSFGMKQLDRGHPLTIFLNDRGVNVGSATNAAAFAEQQKTIAALIEKGAVVFICPMCMEHYGVVKADLVAGLRVSDPDTIGEYLFKPDTRTLNW